jgi:thiol-disulfide isomerase/thioredoxin
MLPLGTKAIDFNLQDVISGNQVSLKNFEDRKALVVMFICKHCPYVRYAQSEIARVGKDYSNKSLGVIAISANDVSAYPEDSPEGMRKQAQEVGFTFPYCYDEAQETAKAYTAACTPDFFLFDRQRKLVYRGQLDGSRPGNGLPLTGEDLRVAIDAVLEDKPINSEQRPSTGCSIKWKG